MSQWYEIKQEVRSTSNGQTSVVSRYSMAHVQSGAQPRRSREAPRIQGGRPDAARSSRYPPAHPPGPMPEQPVSAGAPRLRRVSREPDPGGSGERTRPGPQRPSPGSRPLPMKPHGLVYDKGFPDPGYYVRVPFGLFKEALQPQLRAPEHLTPAHLVDCLIQVYRIYRPLSLDRLALVERNDPRDARFFQVLTSEQAQALGLHLDPQSLPGAPPPNAMPVAQPGQHLWTIFVLFDPTRVQATGRPQSAAAHETAPDQAESPELTPDD